MSSQAPGTERKHGAWRVVCRRRSSQACPLAFPLVTWCIREQNHDRRWVSVLGSTDKPRASSVAQSSSVDPGFRDKSGTSNCQIRGSRILFVGGPERMNPLIIRRREEDKKKREQVRGFPLCEGNPCHGAPVCVSIIFFFFFTRQLCLWPR